MGFWRHLGGELRRCCDLLLPPACLLCGRRLPGEHPADSFCPDCLSRMPVPAPSRCPLCAAPHRTLTPSLHHCGNCLKDRPPFTAVHTVGGYSGTLREAIQLFKYHGALPLEKPLGSMLAHAVKNAPGAAIPGLIVPVPLHSERLRERGYNQALQVARQLGRQLGVPVDPVALCRTRPTIAQQGLDARHRRENLRGVFAAATPLDNRRVMLVDDVMTTGTTARECSRALLAAGAVCVEVAVVARA